MKENPKIIFFGAGAVGQSAGGWLAQNYQDIYFVDQGDVKDTMNKKGVTLYQQGDKASAYNVALNVIENLDEINDADIIVICVKNYSLVKVCEIIKEKCNDQPYIIGLQNGLDNQNIIPKYFSKVIYGVVGYNAWFDEPGVLGYQKKGPIILGTKNNEMLEDVNTIAAIFNKGVETMVVDHLQNAVHSKLVINLTNSLTTLSGHGFKEISDMGIFQNLISNLLYEGSLIIKKSGYKECKIGGMPSWMKLKMAATLPQFITKGMFKRNVKKMVMSSMAQDIIQRGAQTSELDSINGYFLQLAKQNNFKAPYNETIYDLCKLQFSQDSFKPMDVRDIWKEVEKNL